MKAVAQDIINNFLIFFFAFYICKEQERKPLFFLRSIITFALICIIRYLYFNHFLGLFSGLDSEIVFQIRMLGFVLLIFLVVIAVVICYKCDFFVGLFSATIGYCIQHICQRGYSYFSSKLSDDAAAIFYYLVYLAIIVIAFTIFYFSTKKFNFYYLQVNKRTTTIISIFAIIVTIYLNIYMNRYSRGGSEGLRICCNIAITLISLLIILFDMAKLKVNNTEIERDNVKEILKKSKEQYQYEKSIIDLMNIKFHDLKHQIDNLSTEEQNNLSNEISDAVETYDSIVRTNNPALDVVLTRNSFICKKKNIYYTCMADNDCLSSFKETDIYSLFGNILDNAIEAVDKIENAEKRVIDIRITKKNYFVNIHQENYFSGQIKFLEGLPQTIKKDKDFHGYGTKSIQSIVNKYKGNLEFKVQDDRFILDIILPVNEK